MNDPSIHEDRVLTTSYKLPLLVSHNEDQIPTQVSEGISHSQLTVDMLLASLNNLTFGKLRSEDQSSILCPS